MSERVIASGTISPIETGPTTRWEEREGFTSEYSYEGTRAECNSKLLALKASGAKTVMVGPAGNGNWRVEASFAGSALDEGGPESDPPVSTHELDVIAEQIPWTKSQHVRTFFGAGVASQVIATISMAVQKWQSDGLVAFTTDSAISKLETKLAAELTTIGASGTERTNALKLFYHIVTYGFDTATQYNNVYSRTITAASYSQIQAAYTGIGKIWTSGEVVSQEGVPESEWFGLDPNVLWLKSPPRVSASSGGKTQVSYHYTSAPWFSKFTAPAYSAASLVD